MPYQHFDSATLLYTTVQKQNIRGQKGTFAPIPSLEIFGGQLPTPLAEVLEIASQKLESQPVNLISYFRRAFDR